jgi:uncharacterized membrane protein
MWCQAPGKEYEAICLGRRKAASLLRFRNQRELCDERSAPERHPARRLRSEPADDNRPLYAASFLVGITGIVGLVLAYVWKGEPHEPWEETHYIYLIRTFWIGLAGVVIGTVLTVVLIGFLILLATALWVIVRTVMSLVNAQKRAAMPNPAALLF